jgi:hypothetical protein
MDMTAEEIKQFWRGFCERRRLSEDIIAKGEAKIERTRTTEQIRRRSG